MEFVAADLMEADEQLFRWLLESSGCQKVVRPGEYRGKSASRTPHRSLD